MKVLKFGGTSVGTVESLTSVKKIEMCIRDRYRPPAYRLPEEG